MPRRSSSPVVTVLALGGAGLAVAAGAARRIRSERKKRRADDRGVAVSGRAERTAQMTAIGGRIAADAAVHKATSRLVPEERREAVDQRFEERTVEHVVDALGQMKGLMMKLGQMESFTDDSLSDTWREGLTTLLSDAPTMSAAAAAGLVEAELGRRPTDLFESWDDEPFAAASVGQVHGARLDDGREVAVKVQYPGAAEALRADLDNLGALVSLAGRFGSATNEPEAAEAMGGAEAVVGEMRERLLEELDYGTEAGRQATFAARYRGHPFVHVPEVVTALSTPRVLTTERVTGSRFDEVIDTWTQSEKDLVGETLFRFVIRGVFVDGHFNGDPHPGNYLFNPGGRVTFLDFGLVKSLDPQDTARLAALPLALLGRPDLAAFRRAAEDLGLVRAGASLDDTALVGRYGWHYDFLAGPGGPTTVSVRNAAVPDLSTLREDPEAAREFFASHGDPDPAIVIFTRVWRGLRALLARLGAEVDYHAVATEILVAGSPVGGRLGRADAEWRAARS